MGPMRVKQTLLREDGLSLVVKGLQATFSAGLLPDKRCNKHRVPKKKKGVETGERETNVTKLKNEKH